MLVLLGALAIGGVWWIWQHQTTYPTRDGAPSWAQDGRHLVFYSERGGKADLFVMDDKGGDVRQLTRTPAANEGGAAFSPDGKRIAFDTDRDGNDEIYVMDTDGQNPRRLTRHAARDLAPAWSPNGAQIVFLSDRDRRKDKEFDIYRMDADGSSVERLTSKEANWFPQYSADGGRVAFQVGRGIEIMDLGSHARRKVTGDPADGMYPTWSPDGRRLAFVSWRNGRGELFTMNTDGTGQERVVTMPVGSTVDPRWSPAGDRLAFVHLPDDGAGAQRRIIYVAELGTGRLTRLSK